MLRSLVGSEMCIRDRVSTQSTGAAAALVAEEDADPAVVAAAAPPVDAVVVDPAAEDADLPVAVATNSPPATTPYVTLQAPGHYHNDLPDTYRCLLYTSDAADEEDSVDLGGRRIIKKKKKKRSQYIEYTA
eukprot:TRINITY_DN10647_c0_g1_i1.p1 TRINITY_DN10647_c0_g1~~TRINITY_DN10647_c0_g1_i1.p1  ORF type:complete len:131 (-),score=38.99 TRINITY_DN10647_c0_g1_i1:72-464(-)